MRVVHWFVPRRPWLHSAQVAARGMESGVIRHVSRRHDSIASLMQRGAPGSRRGTRSSVNIMINEARNAKDSAWSEMGGNEKRYGEQEIVLGMSYVCEPECNAP